MSPIDFVMAEFIKVNKKAPSVRFSNNKNSGLTLQELQSGNYDLPSNVRSVCVYYTETMPETDENGNQPLNRREARSSFLFVDGEIYDRERLQQEVAQTKENALQVMKESGADLVVKTRSIKGDKTFPFKPFYQDDAIIGQNENGLWQIKAVHPDANGQKPKYMQ